MRDASRIEPFCHYLAQIWKAYFPDWRFGQFICNVIDWANVSPFYIEEEEFKQIIDKFVEETVLYKRS